MFGVELIDRNGLAEELRTIWAKGRLDYDERNRDDRVRRRSRRLVRDNRSTRAGGVDKWTKGWVT